MKHNYLILKKYLMLDLYRVLYVKFGFFSAIQVY